ncbi:MAG: DegT/DnrJ/EryC1/StrS family aminotransferase [Flavobacteriales bacterium]|nr:DegT/DnrJ/EryC1/StrS family aminotransferase [Flavobacteriales bacterium]MCB9194094.1 DegT/DnrJ/EryC1/StrS family aminotransferase [Flavobacteriales bacterium]
MIPFSPPRIDSRTLKAVEDVLRSGWITTGPRTKEFEKRLATYCGADRVIALNSWTNACELALRWFGVGPGDEVIVPAYTYCATANIVMHVGAKLVLVDVLDDFTIDPQAVRHAVSPRTKAIIPVDIGGLPAHMEEIMRIAEEARARFSATGGPQSTLGRPLVLSDAAHSFGARIDDRPVGTQADITGFSFHAVKNLTTAEGGALAFHLPRAFDVEAIYQWFNTMSLHGQSKDALAKNRPGAWRYDVTAPGFKCNMTDIQAAIGLVELERYDTDTLPRRRKIVACYQDAFAGDPRWLTPIMMDEHRTSSFHLYMLRARHATEEQRDAVIRAIAERQVSVNVHFIPLPMLSHYQGLGYRIQDFPNAYQHYAREISLPVYYDLKDEQVAAVIAATMEAMSEIMG